jgi:hypothetical protein
MRRRQREPLFEGTRASRSIEGARRDTSRVSECFQWLSVNAIAKDGNSCLLVAAQGDPNFHQLTIDADQLMRYS